MKLNPLERFIVIEPLNTQQTASGLYTVTNQTDEKVRRGTVIACPHAVPLDVGDVVVYSAFGINEYRVDGKTLHIVDYKEIFGVE